MCCNCCNCSNPPRSDAVPHNGRWTVPTIYGQEHGNTKWVSTWAQFAAVPGRKVQYEADQIGIRLMLPAGYKFSIDFQGY